MYACPGDTLGTPAFRAFRCAFQAQADRAPRAAGPDLPLIRGIPRAMGRLLTVIRGGHALRVYIVSCLRGAGVFCVHVLGARE